MELLNWSPENILKASEIVDKRSLIERLDRIQSISTVCLDKNEFVLKFTSKENRSTTGNWNYLVFNVKQQYCLSVHDSCLQPKTELADHPLPSELGCPMELPLSLPFCVFKGEWWIE